MLLVPIVGCRAVEPVSDSPMPTIEVRLVFRALWWSESQMDALDVNNPPDKDTEVFLERWEYSDPIGIPHPDRVDVLAIVNPGTISGGHEIDLHGTARWRVGPRADESAASWTEPEPLPAIVPVTLVAGQEVRIHLDTIDIRSMQENLQPRDAWPWTYEINVRATTSSVSSIATPPASARLPILLGD